MAIAFGAWMGLRIDALSELVIEPQWPHAGPPPPATSMPCATR
jgi:hypothetical protein